MPRVFSRTGLTAGAGLIAFARISAACAQTAPEQVLIQGSVIPPPAQQQLPLSVESVDAETLLDSVNVTNTEDALKYLPDVLVRKRHIGDTQAPIATRTSGVGSSARSLIYADGMLLSALIGNNNTFASPRWGMIAPDEIARIDVLYGPFAAQYPGNSIGTVVEITTRMPDHFEASLRSQAVLQDFAQYGTRGTYPAYALSGLAGDRDGKFSWRASYSHLYSRSQPLAFVTAAKTATSGAAGTPVTGASDALSRTGAPVSVLGAGGLEHQAQDNLMLKLGYDIAPGLTAAYTVGLFLNDDKAGAETYLRDASGAPVYSGTLDIGGSAEAVAASAFANNVYRLQETHVMQSLSLESRNGGAWDWQLIGSLYDFATDRQRAPSLALPGALAGGAGSITDMKGTGWATADAKATWRPDGANGTHVVSFGAHADADVLKNSKYDTADWLAGSEGALNLVARGDTETWALWAQDIWRFAPALRLTLGGRYEFWRAYDGFNFSQSPALAVRQPGLDAQTFSPKAALGWQIDSDWQATASFGSAYRFPTVSELYQTVTTGLTISVPNPDLKPEHALSGELALEKKTANGHLRFSLFEENISDALISQSAPLAAGSTTLFNYVQNIGRTQTYGVEAVAQQDDVLFHGLSLQGSVTYADPRIASDAAFPAAVGKRIPQVPSWRGEAVAAYHADDDWVFTLAARASSRTYATIDNSDSVTHTFQGFDPYVVLDARVDVRLDAHWNAALGIDNLTDRKYFLYHPFPQRSYVAELRYVY